MTASHPATPVRRVGVFIIGARGAVGSCVSLGLSALRSRRIATTGLVTARELFKGVPLADPAGFVVGGVETQTGTLHAAASRMAAEGVVSKELVEAERGALDEIDRRIVPGFLDAPDAVNTELQFYPETLAARGASAADFIKNAKLKIQQFKRDAAADVVIVVNLASTEAVRPQLPDWTRAADLDRDIAANLNIPASTLYAYAAIDAGCPYINFTPSLGARPAALDEFARKRGVPHAGCDGKTGETLMKTVLAPLFRDRNLDVLAWEGYNLLGNADGRTLIDPAHKAGKLANKDQALRQLLGDGANLHTRVSIDYVPSLGDWKTAWDFIHFAGFFGTKMTLQFTWSGSDSALAAPLVIDLIRLADLSHRRGETGAMPHAAAFFKSPLGCDTHDFHKQNELLAAYARGASE